MRQKRANVTPLRQFIMQQKLRVSVSEWISEQWVKNVQSMTVD